MSAHSYIKARLLELGRLKGTDLYIPSENIITYEPNISLAEIPDNGLIAKQNASDLISKLSNQGLVSSDIFTI